LTHKRRAAPSPFAYRDLWNWRRDRRVNLP
jgi:hypothetical protein